MARITIKNTKEINKQQALKELNKKQDTDTVTVGEVKKLLNAG